ncbi:thioredoxin-like domain-containing protein [Bombardia bombarda]|uniref:protein disulfide-isomerase n=1 Tax=Bombardia bombarda TaxID=252184 RepID=A0AA40C1C1_9PEZI|nr:thioredoxin-like domain-containing protein [Bombardia bombarda]
MSRIISRKTSLSRLFLTSTLFFSAIVSGWNHATAEDLQQAFAAHDVVMPDEPKSASLEPEWLLASETASERGQHLISIDCHWAKAACEDYQAASSSPSSFPSIVLLQSGKPVSQYQGARRSTALLQFLNRRSQPAVTEALSADSLYDFRTTDDTVFIAFLGPEPDSNERLTKSFSDVALRYQDEFLFGTVVDPAVAKSEGIEAPAVVCYRPVGGDRVVLSLPSSPPEDNNNNDDSKLEAWLKEASRPILGDLTVLNHQRLLDRNYPIIYLFATTPVHRHDLTTSLSKFARTYYDSLTFVLADPLDFPSLMAQLGLDPTTTSLPAGAVHQLSNNRIYPYPRGRPFTSSAIQQWGLDVYQGRVKPWTAPGTTPTTNAGDGRGAKTRIGVAGATRKVVSMRNIPGVKIKIAGRDEL